MIAALLKRFAAWFVPKAIVAVAILLGLAGVYVGIRRAGRQDERDAQAHAGLDAIAKANKAAQTIDHSSEAIAHDPDNLDRRRP